MTSAISSLRYVERQNAARLEMQLTALARFLFLAQAVTTCHHRVSMQCFSLALPASLRIQRREAVLVCAISASISC